MNPLGPGDPLRLGPYRLVAVLGDGGMGRVYLGRDGTGRAAAVKVLRRELAYDQNMAQRFVREAQVAQAVTSMGVARVLGAWYEGSWPWMATEFLAGPTLDQHIEEYGPFDDLGVRELGAALARALQDIHAAGLVHRDLKPSNIVMTSSGPRIIDFGIARPEHGLTLTLTGQIPVTPGYGAPEQVLGHRVGPPADVFSLGAVLVYAASGERAYDGGHVATVQYEVVHGEPNLSEVPEPIRVLVAPCLAKDPAHRPIPAQIAAACATSSGTKPSAKKIWQLGELAADIKQREAAAKQLISVPDVRTPSAPSRRRLITALAAGGGTVLAAGGGGLAWWLLSKDGGQGEARKPSEEESTAPPKPWDAKRLTASQYEDGTTPPSLWGPQEGPSPVVVQPLPVRDLVLVHDGGSTTLGAYNVIDGKRKWGTDVGSYARYVAPSDELVVTVGPVTVGRTGRLLALDSATGEKKWTAPADAVHVIAADAESVYFTARRDWRQSDVSLLGAFDMASRTTRWTVPMPVECTLVTPPEAATDSGRLVLCGQNGKVVALDTHTGKQVWTLPRQAVAILPIAPAVSKGIVYLGGKSLTARKLQSGEEIWSLPAKSEFKKTYGGWGAPVLDGDALYALDGEEISRRDRRDGKADWTRSLGDVLQQLDPPVVQGKTVWANVHSLDSGGIAVLHKDTGKPAWTYARDGSGGWGMAASGNRVFLVHGGKLTAMPVF
ncbi:protein kinase domain-containing protein [Streptomyces sp. ME19-01-6]|uniref:protein kinase domain-containing protein n=1 Tax=Streptomyces sp. ME19-01-6 TaxID=3028686 RepID=UPI0029A69998|nr:PQQ-binding-like beta-propeller repeat protein [Streptomyces sp. ME19-01-6]MDX3233440.1 PQQ-binding-like beta-propeller repeat protein [Streptomyces sp. ME19-01-6]